METKQEELNRRVCDKVMESVAGDVLKYAVNLLLLGKIIDPLDQARTTCTILTQLILDGKIILREVTE